MPRSTPPGGFAGSGGFGGSMVCLKRSEVVALPMPLLVLEHVVHKSVGSTGDGYQRVGDDRRTPERPVVTGETVLFVV